MAFQAAGRRAKAAADSTIAIRQSVEPMRRKKVTQGVDGLTKVFGVGVRIDHRRGHRCVTKYFFDICQRYIALH
jgi:hypothetical protein